MPVLLLFMTNHKVMLTIGRDPIGTRAISNVVDYHDIFSPMPAVEREIPSRVQPPRGSTHMMDFRLVKL